MTVAISGNPKRRLLHTRKVVCTGFERDDGLFDIEASLLDTKGVDTEFAYGTIPANGVLHYMRITMTIDQKLVIRELKAVSEQAPTPVAVISTAPTGHWWGCVLALASNSGWPSESVD
nr:DUF2889 domain-containing protein [uncultured Pseudomonas sp.]